MKYAYLIGALISFGLSFVISQYFIQFIVLAGFLSILYMVQKNSCDVEALKKTIEEHNELIKQDIEAIKKQG